MKPFLKRLGELALEGGKALLGSLFGAVKKEVALSPSQADDLFLGIAEQVIRGEISGARLNLTGDQKRELSAAVVEQMILKSALAAGKKLTDPVKFRADVKALVGVVADILNDFHADAAQSQDVT